MRLFFRGILCSILILMSSCVENVDFNQANNLVVTPAVTASLVNSTITQNELVIGGSEINMPITQTSLFTVFENENTSNKLERAVLQFNINNRFNRGFRIEFLFLQENDTTAYGPITLNINPNQSDFTQQEEIILANNPNFRTARKVRVTVQLLPSTDGSMIDINVPASLIFKSSGTFHFRIS